MIRGLDGDETVFLDMVAKQQEEIANRRFDEESQEIKEYRVRQVWHYTLNIMGNKLLLNFGAKFQR